MGMGLQCIRYSRSQSPRLRFSHHGVHLPGQLGMSFTTKHDKVGGNRFLYVQAVCITPTTHCCSDCSFPQAHYVPRRQGISSLCGACFGRPLPQLVCAPRCMCPFHDKLTSNLALTAEAVKFVFPWQGSLWQCGNDSHVLRRLRIDAGRMALMDSAYFAQNARPPFKRSHMLTPYQYPNPPQEEVKIVSPCLLPVFLSCSLKRIALHQHIRTRKPDYEAPPSPKLRPQHSSTGDNEWTSVDHSRRRKSRGMSMSSQTSAGDDNSTGDSETNPSLTSTAKKPVGFAPLSLSRDDTTSISSRTSGDDSSRGNKSPRKSSTAADSELGQDMFAGSATKPPDIGSWVPVASSSGFTSSDASGVSLIRIVAAEAGKHHSIALDQLGGVWTWGSNPEALGEFNAGKESASTVVTVPVCFACTSLDRTWPERT